MSDHKLKKRSDFLKLRKEGRKVVGKFYLFVFLPSQEPGFAVIASKKVGNAVKRNYEKRLMRQLIRENQSGFPSTQCLIVRLAKREGEYSEKQRDFSAIVCKLNKAMDR